MNFVSIRNVLQKPRLQVICSIITSMLKFPMDALFEVLSAPTADSAKVEAADTTIKQIGRRMSNAGRRMSNAALSASVAVAQTLTKAAGSSSSATREVRRAQGSEVRQINEAAALRKKRATISMGTISERAAKNYNARQSQRFSMLITDRSNTVPADSRASPPGGGGGDGGGGASSSAPPPAMTESESFNRLQIEIRQQRASLSAAEREVFDAVWGLSSAFEGKFRFKPVNVDKAVRKELALVDKKAKAKIEKLSLADDDHIGLELLHLFVLDVLGRDTTAARIFELKTDEDFKHTRVVAGSTKSLCFVAVLLLNIFFAYFSVVGVLKM